MGRTKEMLYNERPDYLFDAEYMEWVMFNEQPYYAKESTQDTIQPTETPIRLTQDEFGVYSCREEDN